jgi:hypothetical protein
VFCEAAGVKITKIHKLFASHLIFKKAFFKVCGASDADTADTIKPILFNR